MALDRESISRVKDKADACLSRGRYDEALRTLESVEGYGDRDPRIHLRLGDVKSRLGDTPGAVGSYKRAVDSFARAGFTVKAIGVCKLIARLDPGAEDVQRKLAELCAGEGGSAAGAPRKKTRRLPRTPLFSDLRRDELFDVVRKVRLVGLDEACDLFKSGDRGDSIFIVLSGRLDVVGARDGEDAAVRVATLGEGEFFGEFGYFSSSRRRCTVRASAPAEVLEIKKADMDRIIADHPRVSRVMFDYYKERVVDTLMALSRVFGPLGEAERKEVLKELTPARFEEGAVVLREGESGDSMHLVQEGKARVWVDDGRGGERTLTGLDEGDFFGEIALATTKPRVANVSALTDLKTVVFSRPTMRRLVEAHPEIRSALEEVIRERVAGAVKARKDSASGAML